MRLKTHFRRGAATTCEEVGIRAQTARILQIRTGSLAPVRWLLVTSAQPRLIVSCVAENQAKWHTLAYNLALSCMTTRSTYPVRFVANFVDGVDPAAGRRIEDLGGEVRVVARVDRRNPYLNKLRMLELADSEDFEVLAALDCDTIVVRDLSPHVSLESVGAKPADMDPLTPEQWTGLYTALGLCTPTTEYIATISGARIGPYFNSGVLLIPRRYCGLLLDAWTDMNDRILGVYRDHPEMIPSQSRVFLDQYSLACALAATAIPVRALPSELNYPVHLPMHVPVHPAARSSIEPVIAHYHKNITANGFLTRSRNEEVNADLHAFNLRRSAALGMSYSRLPDLPLKERALRAMHHCRKTVRGAAVRVRTRIPGPGWAREG